MSSPVWRSYLEPIVDRARSKDPSGFSVLLLRHSIREPILLSTVDAADRARLTDEGRDMARRFGERLDPSRSIRLYHSPVARCAHTASCIDEAFRSGNGRSDVMGARSYLAAPYLRDPCRAMKMIGDAGLTGFLLSWIRGEIAPDIAQPMAQTGAALLRDLVTERLSAAPGSLDIHITHDLTILAVMSLGFDLSDPERMWPDFLEGVALSRADNLVRAAFREMEVPIECPPAGASLRK